MSEVSSQFSIDPITAVGVVSSPSKAPDGYYVVSTNILSIGFIYKRLTYTMKSPIAFWRFSVSILPATMM